MQGFSSVSAADAHRVRRWDVIILGGSLPGLIAAVRLGQRGARVLIVEEKAARDGIPLLREPFVMTDAEPTGVLGACLRTLGVPLIDQRRFQVEEIAVQLVLPDARIDVGRGAMTAAELSAWGLTKPDAARALMRALEGAAAAEREAMLDGAPPPRGTQSRRKRTDLATPAALPFARGWPREAVDAAPPVQAVLAAIGRGASHLGENPRSPEARARLVGGLLSGAAVLTEPGSGLREMIQRRAKALLAEFRTLPERFDIVTVGGQPAIALANSEEIWAGRTLLLNAPLAGIARAMGDSSFRGLPASEPTRRRVLRHFRGPREVFPEAMCDRVICMPDPGAGREPPVVTLRRAPAVDDDRATDLVAAATGPAEAPIDQMQAWIERVVRRLLPFSDDSLQTLPLPTPVWDTDTLISESGEGWPHIPDSRVSLRPSIHWLDRAALGSLGYEGDLLLGVQIADAAADELP